MVIAKQTTGLREITGYAWIIHVYGRDYIYHGTQSGISAAVAKVKKEPRNAGSKVTYKKIVG